MRWMMERSPMAARPRFDRRRRQARLLDRHTELLLRALPRFEEIHLNPALHVDLAVAGGLDGGEDGFRIARRDERLHAVRDAGGRHAAERFDADHHVRLSALDGLDELAHFHVTLA